jgi:hypothetical protein
MASNRKFVRVSTPAGHFSVPTAVAERAGSSWRVLKQDAVDRFGHVLPPKPREDVDEPSPARKTAAKKAAARRTPELRDESVAATPTEPETVSGDTPKE